MKRKVYVRVKALCHPDGYVEPLAFVWEDGTVYAIDRVFGIERRASMEAGGLGLCYTVRVKGRRKLIWLEDETRKWFMEGKPI